MRRLLRWLERAMNDDSTARAFGFDSDSPLTATSWRYLSQLT